MVRSLIVFGLLLFAFSNTSSAQCLNGVCPLQKTKTVVRHVVRATAAPVVRVRTVQITRTPVVQCCPTQNVIHNQVRVFRRCR